MNKPDTGSINILNGLPKNDSDYFNSNKDYFNQDGYRIKYYITILTKNLSLELRGSYEDIMEELKTAIPQQGLTEAVSIHISTLYKDDDTSYYKQDVMTQSSISLVAEFREHPVEEIKGIIGLLQKELNFLEKFSPHDEDEESAFPNKYYLSMMTRNLAMDKYGSYKEIMENLRGMVTVQGLTETVSINLSTIFQDRNTGFYGQAVKIQSSISVAVRFNQRPVEEIDAIIGLLKKELNFLDRFEATETSGADEDNYTGEVPEEE